jgi:hypothetical protein
MAAAKKDEPVFAGPPADGPTPTVDVTTDAGSAPAEANLTEDGPAQPSDKPVKFQSPWGSSITVSSDVAEAFKDAGYKSIK